MRIYLVGLHRNMGECLKYASLMLDKSLNAMSAYEYFHGKAGGDQGFELLCKELSDVTSRGSNHAERKP